VKASFCMMGFGYSQDIAEECIALVSTLGYDGIEFWKQYLDQADLDWIRRAADRARLEIVQICPYFDFTGSEETYEATLREGEVFVGYARKLGARYVRTYTGRIGSAEATDEQWERAVRGRQAICDMGAPFGIEFPLETHQVIHNPACLMDTSASTLRLLKLVNRPNLRVSLQTPLAGETPEYTAAQLGTRVVHVQAHNWIGATDQTWGKLTFLDAGDLNFAHYLRILVDKGFDGYVSIDHPNHDPWKVTAEHEIHYLKRLFAGEIST